MEQSYADEVTDGNPAHPDWTSRMAGSPGRLAALFGDRRALVRARRELLRQTRIPASNCEVMFPGLPPRAPGRRADSRFALRSLLAWQTGCGLAGLAGGLAVSAVLAYRSPDLARVGPGLLFFIAGAFGTAAGALVGGAISLRPGRSLNYSRLRDRVRGGEFAMVIRFRNPDERREAEAVLRSHAASIYRIP